MIIRFQKTSLQRLLVLHVLLFQQWKARGGIPEEKEDVVLEYLLSKLDIDPIINPITVEAKKQLLYEHLNSVHDPYANEEVTRLVRYYESNLFHLAIRTAHQLIDQGLGYKIVYHKLGQSYQRIGRNDKAVEAFKHEEWAKTARFDTTSEADRTHHLALLLFETDFYQAKQYFLQSIEADPAAFFAYHNFYGLHLVHEQNLDDVNALRKDFDRIFSHSGEAQVIMKLLDLVANINQEFITDPKRIDQQLDDWNRDYNSAEIGMWGMDEFFNDRNYTKRVENNMHHFAKKVFHYRPIIQKATKIKINS
jgi:tetratricopeptide (TPR) repeat protein